MTEQRIALKRLDYQSPAYQINRVELTFELADNKTIVTARSQCERLADNDDTPLVLDGDSLTLIDVRVDGHKHSAKTVSETTLTLHELPKDFDLEVVTEVDPANNTALEGLYKSAGTFCTQCEAQGFRRITYFLDRPDVMATYRVTIIGDKHQYPHMLSNGNLIERGELDNGQHYVVWDDPFAKPCYLFALVAGTFDVLEDRYTTSSGREVKLELYVESGNGYRGHHALASLKKAMAWDEASYGLEYDLDVYMVVAVDFFNMGAMENKGLNIFNSKFVLADPASATDDDFFNIESVVAHEYFHNWTGNRVTCRDWFQLSLKEGLTVFRDQQFSADMSSPVIVRINQVKVIREHQFAEDAGPMSHPIRPDEVMEMNNFYSVTVYDKGAEVIRMLHRLLDHEGFGRGMTLYFKRHDGQAVTCDDFVQAMADANERDLTAFKRWYSQSGTPEVTIDSRYDDASQTLTLSLSQRTPPTSDQENKEPLVVPLGIEWFNDHQHETATLQLNEASSQITINNVESHPVIAALTGFSAPIKLHHRLTDEDRVRIAAEANDEFARWDACQSLYGDHIRRIAADDSIKTPEQVPDVVSQLVNHSLATTQDDPALLAEMLKQPGFESLALQQDTVNVDGLLRARQLVTERLAMEFAPQWQQIVEARAKTAYAYTPEQANQRRLLSQALFYLAQSGAPEAERLLRECYETSDNMTLTLAVLRATQQANMPLFDEFMTAFEQRWHNDSLVLDKWFALHSSKPQTSMAERLKASMEHPMFSLNNPNKVRAVWAPFVMQNPTAFHHASGAGYQLLSDFLLQLDGINPQVSARLVTPLLSFKRYDVERQSMMQAQCERLMDHSSISKDVYEKVSRALRP